LPEKLGTESVPKGSPGKNPPDTSLTAIHLMQITASVIGQKLIPAGAGQVLKNTLVTGGRQTAVQFKMI